MEMGTSDHGTLIGPVGPMLSGKPTSRNAGFEEVDEADMMFLRLESAMDWLMNRAVGLEHIGVRYQRSRMGIYR